MQHLLSSKPGDKKNKTVPAPERLTSESERQMCSQMKCHIIMRQVPSRDLNVSWDSRNTGGLRWQRGKRPPRGLVRGTSNESFRSPRWKEQRRRLITKVAGGFWVAHARTLCQKTPAEGNERG